MPNAPDTSAQRFQTKQINSKRPSTPRPTYRFEALLVVEGQSVESIDTHDVQIRAVAGHVEAHDNDEIGKHEDAAFEVVALEYSVSREFAVCSG